MFEFANKETVCVFSEQDAWVIRSAMIQSKASAIVSNQNASYNFTEASFNNRIAQIDTIIEKCNKVIKEAVDKRFAENNQ